MIIRRFTNKFWLFAHRFHAYAEWNKYGEFFFIPSISFYNVKDALERKTLIREFWIRFLFVEINITKIVKR